MQPGLEALSRAMGQLLADVELSEQLAAMRDEVRTEDEHVALTQGRDGGGGGASQQAVAAGEPGRGQLDGPTPPTTGGTPRHTPDTHLRSCYRYRYCYCRRYCCYRHTSPRRTPTTQAQALLLLLPHQTAATRHRSPR